MKRQLYMLVACWTIVCLSACTVGDDENKAGGVIESESKHTYDKEIVADSNANNGEEIIGEGSSPTENQDLENSPEYKMGDVISLENSEYELMIESAKYIEPQSTIGQNERIILVDYSYKNLSDEPLLIDGIRFQMVNTDNTVVYEPYYFQGKITAEIINKNEQANAQLAFVQTDEEDELILVYNSTTDSEMEPISIKIDNIKNN